MLDHHLATFDQWLQEYLIISSPGSHFLAVVALLDQLNLEEFNWQQVSVILQHQLPFTLPDMLLDLFGRTTSKIEFFQIVSKFLMDRERAGLFWVNSQKYADLAKCLLEFLHDK